MLAVTRSYHIVTFFSFYFYITSSFMYCIVFIALSKYVAAALVRELFCVATCRFYSFLLRIASSVLLARITYRHPGAGA